MLAPAGFAAEVAKAMVFLASDDGPLMTGAELVLDGGLIAKQRVLSCLLGI